MNLNVKLSFNKQMLDKLGGVVVVLGVIGAAIYFQLVMAKVEKPPVVVTSYSTGVLDKDFQSGQVFDKTKPLRLVELSQDNIIRQYRKEDLGKSDPTKFE